MSFLKFLKRINRSFPKRNAAVVVLAVAILLGTTQRAGEQGASGSAQHTKPCETESTGRYVLRIVLQSVVAELIDAIKESLKRRNRRERPEPDFCAKLEAYMKEHAIGEDRPSKRQKLLKACKKGH